MPGVCADLGHVVIMASHLGCEKGSPTDHGAHILARLAGQQASEIVSLSPLPPCSGGTGAHS